MSDIERATTFYARLLGVPGVRVSSGRHYFDCGGTILACYDPRADTDAFDLPPNPDHLYFTVRDLEAAWQRATTAGAEILDPIDRRPWGERSFYLQDPFGNKLAFVDEPTRFTGSSSVGGRLPEGRAAVRAGDAGRADRRDLGPASTRADPSERDRRRR